MVVKEAAVTLKVESDDVGETDVEAGTCSESRRNLAVIPKVTVNKLVLYSDSVVVVESVVYTDTSEDVWIEGSVELVTGEGDRLNLKSNLCKYVSLAKVFSGDSGIKSIEIIVSEPKDVDKLMQFMIFGSTC